MADEITFGYRTGHNLEYGVYEPDGTPRTAAGTNLPEEGSTGYYHATDNNIEALDFVIVTDAATGVVVGQGQYSPDVTSVAIDLDLTALESKIDALIKDANKVTNIIEPEEEPVRPIVGVSG
jgi:hypothetical protein